MGFGGSGFVLAIIAMSFVAWVITTAIRARHGYPLEGEWGGTVTKKDPATDRLVAENAELKATVDRLEDRLKVLERIATDPSRRLSDDIDNLR
ncbi:MAG: tektin family protein [Sphingomonas bacterium]|nr:tektin family protein [Sphingomonas bacterium]